MTISSIKKQKSEKITESDLSLTECFDFCFALLLSLFCFCFCFLFFFILSNGTFIYFFSLYPLPYYNGRSSVRLSRHWHVRNNHLIHSFPWRQGLSRHWHLSNTHNFSLRQGLLGHWHMWNTHLTHSFLRWQSLWPSAPVEHLSHSQLPLATGPLGHRHLWNNRLTHSFPWWRAFSGYQHTVSCVVIIPTNIHGYNLCTIIHTHAYWVQHRQNITISIQ